MAVPWIASQPAQARRWNSAPGYAPPGPGEGAALRYVKSDGTLGDALLLGWWDGVAIQPATLLGWWDGTTIQPLS